jgi:hypothetical protein
MFLALSKGYSIHMKVPQSEVGFYTELYEALLLPLRVSQDSYFQSCSRRDFATIQARSTSLEGFSFLTKTLPKLDKALIQGLLNSKFACPREFKKRSRLSSIPAFLHAYFSLVFDDESGNLLADAQEWAIQHIRNVCGFVYKLEVPFSDDENQRIVDGFIETESDLSSISLTTSSDVLDAADITERVFKDFNPMDIIPKHGPGAVASGQKGEQKWTFTTKFDSIHQVYPYYSYFMTGKGSELIDRLEWYKTLIPAQSGEAKVVLVPKDSRGPRLISMEPLEYMWLQEGLGKKLATFLESKCSLTRGMVNFSSQQVNRQLALSSSKDGKFATLDLKDASDRVSLDLVRRTFSKCPALLRSLTALRTTATKLPDGSVLPLKKYAPMGSALCFPVEAYTFWVIIVAAISRRRFRPYEEVAREVYVYGDDIIVPTKYASLASRALERVGLKVNTSKSCATGLFRESCGMDAFNGVEVTPLRLRTRWSGKRFDASAFASYTSLANRYAVMGYEKLSCLLWLRLEEVYGKIPYGTKLSAFPCKVVPSAYIAVELNKLYDIRFRWNADIQQIQFRVKSLKARKAKSILDSWQRLLRELTSPSRDSDPSEITFPKTTRVVSGWNAIY